MPQGTFGSLRKTVSGFAHINQKVWRAVDHPLHCQANVDDVFVFGKHKRLVTMGLHLSDVDDVDLVDDRRIPMQTGADFVWQHLTKAEDHTALLLVYLIDAGKAVQA